MKGANQLAKRIFGALIFFHALVKDNHVCSFGPISKDGQGHRVIVLLA